MKYALESSRLCTAMLERIDAWQIRVMSGKSFVTAKRSGWAVAEFARIRAFRSATPEFWRIRLPDN